MYASCSIVVPVYNSELTLRELTHRLGQVLPTLCNQYELILVNDGSRDSSWQVICELAQQYPWVRGLNMMRNYGQHNAVLCGVRSARYTITVTMDDDLQHPPEEIGKLLARLEEGFDVVYGSPARLPHSFIRNLFSRFTKRTLARVMGIPTIRDIGAFRAFRTHLRRAFESYQSPSVLLDVLLSWGTTRFGVVQVEEAPRQIGHSNYNFFKLATQAMLVLTGFSTLPLRFASWVGFSFTIFGFVLFFVVLFQYFSAGSIPGFPFLASVITVFSGTQLFALGIFGEYLARIFDKSMDHPPYVVNETTDTPTVE